MFWDVADIAESLARSVRNLGEAQVSEVRLAK